MRFASQTTSLIKERTAAGSLLARYVHGPGADEPLVSYTSSGVRMYAYVGGDPINGRDPSGLCEGDDDDCEVIVVSDPRLKDDDDSGDAGPPETIVVRGTPTSPGGFGGGGGVGYCFGVNCNFSNGAGSCDASGCTITGSSGSSGRRSSVSVWGFGVARGSLALSGTLLAKDMTGVGVAADVLVPVVLSVGATAAGVAILAETVARVHGNSYRSTRTTTVHQLVSNRTGEILKYGITPRAEPRTRYPQYVYDIRNIYFQVIQDYPTQLEARQHELALCQAYIAARGHRPPFSIIC